MSHKPIAALPLGNRITLSVPLSLIHDVYQREYPHGIKARRHHSVFAMPYPSFPPVLPLRPQHHNFEESQEAMKQQLLQLSLLLKALDPELCDYLGEGPPASITPAVGRMQPADSLAPLWLYRRA